MVGRVVEIAEDGRHLSLYRGFLVVSRHDREARPGERLGLVPLDEIGAVLANAHGLTYSNNLVLALAQRGIPFVLCASNHLPSAILWPVDGHHRQTAILRAQIASSLPLRKRLWQRIVQAKIRQQAAVVRLVTGDGRGIASGLEAMAQRVRSGDPDNLEAQAARRYWPALFGAEFRRDAELAGINSLLNYGYAIIRSGMARAVMAAGLNPTLGVHHTNRGNPMCLVDDLMEPFRPFVDIMVLSLVGAGVDEVTPQAKAALAAVLVRDLVTENGISPLVTMQLRVAQSLVRSLEDGKERLDLPPVQHFAPLLEL